MVRGKHETKGLGGIDGGRPELDMQQLLALSKFLGNNDPLKILQLLSGVQTAGEENSGLFVRGEMSYLIPHRALHGFVLLLGFHLVNVLNLKIRELILNPLFAIYTKFFIVPF